MSRHFNIEYIDELFLKAQKELQNECDINMFDFNRFDLINSYLIHKAIANGNNLHIKTGNKNENAAFYIPVLISVAIFGFAKNYITYDPIPIVGEIIQKDRKRYRVARVVGDKITITNKAEGNLQSEIPLSSYKKYIVTTAERETAGRKLKSGFEHYKRFFDLMFKIGDVMPSKFQFKYLIVTNQDILNALKKTKVQGIDVYKSLPIQYITSGDIRKDNIPIAPMIYVTNDYDTATEYVISEQYIDTILVVGDSKCRECSRYIAQDIRASRVGNVIFIGSESIDNIENLLRWQWTKPEQDILSQHPYYEAEVQVVDNSLISDKIYSFQQVVETIEQRFNITLLKEFVNYIRQASRIIIPNFGSRLNNKLHIIKEDFRYVATDTIATALFDKGISQCDDVIDSVVTSFNDIIQVINHDKWNQFLAIKKSSHLVVSKDYIEEISAVLSQSKIKPIVYSQLGKINNKQPLVCFFSIYGKCHFEECYQSDSFKPIFILYPHEAEYFKLLENRYREDVKRELSSDDRYKISGITYSDISRHEAIETMMQRLFGVLDDSWDKERMRYERGDEVHVISRIEFNNGECEDVDSNKSVILCEGGTSKIITADKLQVGDSVRIYANANKDKLWQIAFQSDTKGIFREIDEASLFWKRCLCDYKDACGLSSEELYDRLRANGLTSVKNSITIDRWLNPQSDTKFPAINRNMAAIKETINNPTFNESYLDICKKKRAYRGIMIGLGRDFSDEIISYIQDGNVVGEMLCNFDMNVIEGFANSNAPIRKITRITYIQDGADEE